MMKRVLCCALLAGACGVLTARAEETKPLSDAQFVMKASAAGLAEVNMGELAQKQAANPAVKKFAERMIQDHTKANKELIALANKQGLRVAPTMDAKHRELSTTMLRLSAAAFDRAYMDHQLKDHKMVIAMFEQESKDGKDEAVRAWAKKTLPTLREHEKLAKETEGKLGGGKEKAAARDR